MEPQSKTIYNFAFALIANILSAYLFSLGRLSFPYLLIILGLSILISLIVSFQFKLNELSSEVDKQILEQKKLSEKLKIHEQLIDMKVNINLLQKKVFK